MFGPLSFPSSSKATKNTISFDDSEYNRTECILCDVTFDLPNQQSELLTHVFEAHRLVIADVPFIASLSKYVNSILSFLYMFKLKFNSCWLYKYQADFRIYVFC